ncbi:MBOAT family O-acyltransferase [Aquicella lusitana]|uniref:Probable alginate O-acetylase n=1 Tax=Aquicella lusitana TaxID=254246 RepID=A0A370GXC1_9COXI|nr:MBOAT family O-acyltransferase [Aquicella lusitana]RDI48129.1 D-alanyl-lipoteichoic acid acyltransferase DltB (MBOAT superfamily) [Aquicella lusitana]VVC72855.1 Peptidoglycan O-acetyltransferase [Aquicella lusitana]
MLFNSYVFIFIFLPIVLLGFLLLRNKTPLLPIGWVALASLFYYSWWKPQFLLLLLGSITINLIFGKILIDGRLSRTLSRVVLTFGIIFNLGVLAYFKYAGFLVANVNEIFGTGLSMPNILLPIGISFITFQKIAFLVDAHRGLARNFTILNYIFFVTFFPQLIAGPIVHHSEIMPQLEAALRRDFKADFAVGISIFIVGLFKKVVIADSLAIYADAGYAMVKAGHPIDTASAWITVIAYALQLYYDFSAYSDMAVGLGRIFGFRLPLNFYSPYKASSIIDFWRRWHITLSRFLRDYLYIPLGGNRHSTLRRYFNLAIVMLLGGLWHGANWTFAVWGGVHGLLLGLNHAWRQLPFTRHRFYHSAPVRMIAIVFTFLLVTLAWIPFRAETIGEARIMLAHLFPFNGGPLGLESFTHFWKAQFTHRGSFENWFKPHELWPAVLSPDYLSTVARPVGILLAVNLLVIFLMPNTSQIFGNFRPVLGTEAHRHTLRGALQRLDARAAFVLAFLFVLSVLGLSHISPFLYFQF